MDDWRRLGFYYDFDERVAVNQWDFTKAELASRHLYELVDEYISNPDNPVVSEHQRYGPYGYLKIMTWSEPKITNSCFAGTLNDLGNLSALVRTKITSSAPGETFGISDDFGTKNTATARFLVMEDAFDPPSIDELIVSGRQRAVIEVAPGKNISLVNSTFIVRYIVQLYIAPSVGGKTDFKMKRNIFGCDSTTSFAR